MRSYLVKIYCENGDSQECSRKLLWPLSDLSPRQYWPVYHFFFDWQQVVDQENMVVKWASTLLHSTLRDRVYRVSRTIERECWSVVWGVYNHYTEVTLHLRPYRDEPSASRPIRADKHRRGQRVLTWVTSREHCAAAGIFLHLCTRCFRGFAG